MGGFKGPFQGCNYQILFSKVQILELYERAVTSLKMTISTSVWSAQHPNWSKYTTVIINIQTGTQLEVQWPELPLSLQGNNNLKAGRNTQH